MKIGKFEISEFVLGMFFLVILVMVILLYGTKVDIEKEKTKQMEIQYNINNGKEVNENE